MRHHFRIGGATCLPIPDNSSDEGYEILVDGQRRSFRDDKATAREAALFLKLVWKGKEKIEIVDRWPGRRVEMFADGRAI